MKPRQLLTLFCFSLCYSCCTFFIDLAAGSSVNDMTMLSQNLSVEKYYPYQDIIINGEVLFKGLGPDCDERWTIIRNLLGNLKGFSLLDLGACNGFFSIKSVQELGAAAFMVDTTDRLLNICELNKSLGGLAYCKNLITPKFLAELREVVLFDVVFAFNILHQIANWKECLMEILELGKIVIIETPPSNDPRALDQLSICEINDFLEAQANFEKIPGVLRVKRAAFENSVACLSDVNQCLESKKYLNGVRSNFYITTKKDFSTSSSKRELFQALHQNEGALKNLGMIFQNDK